MVRETPRAATSAAWVQTELFFGIALKSSDASLREEGERRWQSFLDREVTPRFPDGLSVFDVSGQWLSPKRNAISYEYSKALLILYRNSPQHSADIEAIRDAWKKLTNDESVLRIIQPADVSF